LRAARGDLSIGALALQAFLRGDDTELAYTGALMAADALTALAQLRDAFVGK
jgi:hypothetical protein